MKHFNLFTCYFISIFILGSCTHNPDETHSQTANLSVTENSIYYWKTTFQLSRYDKSFISQHNIKKIYLRLFDVDLNYEQNMPIPIATTRFMEKVPEDLEIVPVVYITTSSLRKINDYALRIYKRILAMGKRNGFENIKEIQLDCDWTKSNQRHFFFFCAQLKMLASNDNIKISATIRLHQLKSDAPPVDRGVLMLYNTGSVYNPRTKNSILNSNDVKPYLNNKINYSLPLSMAYPTYAWGILLRDNQFTAILHKTDFNDTTLYKVTDKNIYAVIKEHYIENKHIHVGDKIRLEHSNINDITKVKSFVKSALPESKGVILYHLDSLNLSRFTEQDINNILQ